MITVVTIGNGTAYVSDANPSDGQTITVYAYPNTGESLDDLYAVDQDGHSIALLLQQVQPLTYRAAWGDVTITAEFSGTPTPPTPTTTKKHKMPIWMYPMFRL